MIQFSIDVLPFYWVSPNSRTHKLNVGMMSREQIERVAMPGSGHRQELKEIQMNAGSLLSFLFSIHKLHLNCFPFRFQFSSVHSFYEPKWETWFAVRGLRNKKNKTKTSKVQKQRQSWERLVQTCAHARTSTVFLGPRHAHKDLFETGMNTRCHLRGSGVCLPLLLLPLRLREGEKKELLRNSRGYDLSVLASSGEVRFGGRRLFFALFRRAWAEREDRLLTLSLPESTAHTHRTMCGRSQCCHSEKRLPWLEIKRMK